jgi:hypothetical protein
MTLIVIAGGAAVPTLACAENRPAAIDSYVATFMASISEQTSAIKLRESHYLNNSLVNSSPRELTMTARDEHDHRLVARTLCRGDSQDKSGRAASVGRQRAVAALIQRRAADAPYPREGSP